MNINTRDMPFINFNGQEMQWIKFNNVVVYEAWKNLIANGVPPLTLLNCKGVDLIDYKIYGNSVQSRLPEEYQEVEYINGIQAYNNPLTTGINLNCKWKDISKIQIKMQFLKLSSNSHGSMIIKSTTNGTNSYAPFICSKTSGIIFEGINGSITNDYTKEQLTKNGMKEIEILIDNNTNSSNMYFGSWQDSAYSMDWQLQYLKMYNTQNKLIRDLVPCYRKADNVVGVYDLVNDVFYTNAGTGTFVKGNNVTPTPEAPIEIQSVGEYDENLNKYKIPVKVNDNVTNIYLDEPLRKVGDYADYIDFENGKIVRNIVKINLSDLSWTTNSTSSKKGQFWAKPNLNIIYPESTSLVSNFLCTDYSVVKYTDYSLKDNIIYSANNTKLIYVRDTDYTDLETFKSEVKGVLLLAQLATPTEETIELPNIPTIKGTTILSVDTNIQPSNVEVVYKGK